MQLFSFVLFFFSFLLFSFLLLYSFLIFIFFSCHFSSFLSLLSFLSFSFPFISHFLCLFLVFPSLFFLNRPWCIRHSEDCCKHRWSRNLTSGDWRQFSYGWCCFFLSRAHECCCLFKVERLDHSKPPCLRKPLSVKQPWAACAKREPGFALSHSRSSSSTLSRLLEVCYKW